MQDRIRQDGGIKEREICSMGPKERWYSIIANMHVPTWSFPSSGTLSLALRKAAGRGATYAALKQKIRSRREGPSQDFAQYENEKDMRRSINANR